MAASPLIGLLRQRPEKAPPPRHLLLTASSSEGARARRDRRLRLLACSIATWIGLGCAGGTQPDSAQSLFGSVVAGEGEPPALAQVREELGLVDDSSITAAVARIGREVVRPAAVRSAEPSFYVVDQADAGVFTVADEFVFVTRGLLAVVASEAELASLLAHELAHGELGDLPVGASGLPALGFGSAVMQAALGRRGAERFAAGAALVGRFSAESEPAADALGQQNAADSGFDAAAFASALSGLDAVRRLRAASMPDFFVRHPSWRTRVAEAKSRAAGLATSGPAAAETGSMPWVEGMLVGPNPADGVFIGNRFVHHDLGYTLRLPRGWERLQARRAVGAVAPGGNAQVVIERQGPGIPPDVAAQHFLDELAGRMPVQVEHRENLRTAGMTGYRAIAIVETPAGRVRLELHWFSLASGVIRLVGASPLEQAEKAEVAMRNVARSLQPLSDRERAQIQEQRLKLVASQAGESLHELSRRSGNVWSPELTAAINRVEVDSPLAAGTQIRIAVRAAFRGRNLGANPVRVDR